MPGRFAKDVTLRQLRALAAVHRHKSVTAAAAELHLTQPAVTLQLRALQALADLPLIQRTPSSGLSPARRDSTVILSATMKPE